jgi:hypothetical protein
MDAMPMAMGVAGALGPDGQAQVEALARNTIPTLQAQQAGAAQEGAASGATDIQKDTRARLLTGVGTGEQAGSVLTGKSIKEIGENPVLSNAYVLRILGTDPAQFAQSQALAGIGGDQFRQRWRMEGGLEMTAAQSEQAAQGRRGLDIQGYNAQTGRLQANNAFSLGLTSNSIQYMDVMQRGAIATSELLLKGKTASQGSVPGALELIESRRKTLEMIHNNPNKISNSDKRELYQEANRLNGMLNQHHGYQFPSINPDDAVKSGYNPSLFNNVFGTGRQK